MSNFLIYFKNWALFLSNKGSHYQLPKDEGTQKCFFMLIAQSSYMLVYYKNSYASDDIVLCSYMLIVG
jgi:hypothetical protein